MNYDQFNDLLHQEIADAQRICEATGSLESVVKALLFRERTLTEAEKDEEYSQFLPLVHQAEENIVKLAFYGRETFDKALHTLTYAPVEKELNAQSLRLLRREEEQEIGAYSLPDSTKALISDLRHAPNMRHMSTEQQLRLLGSITLCNGMHDAASGLLTLSDNEEFIRRMKRLEASSCSSPSEKEQRQLLAALLLNMRRRGILPDELESQYKGKPLLSDLSLLTVFLCADERMQQFTRAGKSDPDWASFFLHLAECIPMLIVLIAAVAALIINVVKDIKNPISFATWASAAEGLLLGPIADIGILLVIAMCIFVILEPLCDAFHAIFPEETELDRQETAFEDEMRSMARSLFTQRTGYLNTVVLNARNQERQARKVEQEPIFQRETQKHLQTE